MDFPKTFKDDLGRSWTVDITVGTLKRLRALCNFSIDELVSEPNTGAKDPESEAAACLSPLRSFFADSLRFSEILYTVCRPDADRQAVTSDQFDDGFRGESLQLAQEAFLQALHDFFRSPPKRMLVRGVIEETKQVKAMMMTATKRVESMAGKMTPGAMEKIVEKKIDDLFLKRATESPELAEFIQTVTPFVS